MGLLTRLLTFAELAKSFLSVRRSLNSVLSPIVRGCFGETHSRVWLTYRLAWTCLMAGGGERHFSSDILILSCKVPRIGVAHWRACTFCFCTGRLLKREGSSVFLCGGARDEMTSTPCVQSFASPAVWSMHRVIHAGVGIY
jgi:hypothetical protein